MAKNMKTIRWLVLATTLATTAPLASTVSAQDWSVQGGDARQQEIVKRYQALLERTPNEGLAFQRLLDHVGKGKGLDNLIAHYASRVEAKPDAANLRLILGHLYKSKNEYDQALPHYEKAVELAPDDALTWLSRGSIHVLLQNGEQATADFEKALSLEKDKQKKQEILRKLADSAFTQRDWERAQTYYDQLVALEPRSEFLRMEYAQVLIQYKRYEKAMEQYDALLKLVGRNTSARATTMRDIGDLYERMGKDDEAIETYESAMKLMASTNWLYRELSQRVVSVYRRADRLPELIEKYEKAWRNPNYDQALLLGTLFEEVGREDDALAAYNRARARNSRASDPRLRIIRILERRGKDKEVIAAYKSLIAVSSDARHYFDLVRVYFRIGDRKAAQALLKQVESRFSRDADVHATLADTYMRFEMNEDALRIYQKLVRMDPRNDAYILGLGEYYYQNGDANEAVKTWERLLNSSLDKAEAHSRLGQVLIEHGIVERGLQEHERAVEVAPEDEHVRRAIALAYERARRWEPAIEAWTWLLERAEQPLTANEARSRIIAIYQRQNKLDAKLREYAAAFAHDPTNFNAGFFLSEAYIKMVMYDQAEQILQQIVTAARGGESAEQEVAGLIALERLYGQKNDLEAAIAVLQRLAELLPARSREYYHRIADLSLKMYEDDQAVHYASLAVQMNPDDALAQARLGDVYHKMGRLEAAAQQYQEAIDLDPRAFETSMKLAQLLLELGQDDQAEKLFREVTKQSADEAVTLDAARTAIALAEVDGRLEEVEEDFYSLVYRTPPRPVYRKIMLEIYDRLSHPYVVQDRYGAMRDRSAASSQLEAIGARALPVLVDALTAEDVGQRALAVRLLGEFRQPNGALPLGRIIDDERDSLRLPAAIAIAQIGDPRGAPALIRMTNDSNHAMRETAIWALGAVGGDAATRRLSELLMVGHSWRDHVLAAIALGRIGTPRAVDVLLEKHAEVDGDASSAVTAIAVTWGLGRAGDPRAATALLKSSAQPNRVGRMAAWALGQIGGTTATRTLIERHWADNAEVRAAASRALVQLAGRDEGKDTRRDRAPRLHRTVDEVRAEVRFIEVRTAAVSVVDMVEALEQAAAVVVPGDAAEFVEKNTARFIDVARQRLREPSGAAIVTSGLLAIDGRLALGALTSSDDARFTAAVRQIVAGLREPLQELAKGERGAASQAVALLGALGQADDLALILARANGTGADRRYALTALGGYPAERVQSVLIEATQDGDYRARIAAAQALGRTLLGGGDRAAGVAALLVMLQDPFPTVRIAAASALGALNDPSAIPALAAIASDRNLSVQVAALEAIAQIGGPQAHTALEKYQQSDDLRVRKAASVDRPSSK